MRNKSTNPSLPRSAETASVSQNVIRKRLPWTILFLIIAALTIWAVTSQNKSFSFHSFISFLGQLNPFWLTAAVAAMLCYIIFEGVALLTISKSFGHRRSLGKGYSYAAADIYFSAITPSATGGQPGSAFLMMKDGIPGSTATVILLLNLVMYGVAILILGVLCFIIKPSVFQSFTPLSKVLIIVGVAMQVLLVLFFVLLLKCSSILRFLGDKCLAFLGKIHLIRRPDKKRMRFKASMDSYDSCVAAIGKKRGTMIKALVFNVIQRGSLLAVTVFTFLAATGDLSRTAEFFAASGMIVLASNYIPIPGAMGVTDALMLDSFTSMLGAPTLVANLQLLSRSISLYLCVFLCGVSFFLRCIFLAVRKPKGAEKAETDESTASEDGSSSL